MNNIQISALSRVFTSSFSLLPQQKHCFESTKNITAFDTGFIFAGMYTGYNALSMALAMPENGYVVACEIEENYVNIAKPFFKEVRTFLNCMTYNVVSTK